ncbi:MAG: recombinase family protein [Kofleriaceae bacterium]|nr:recombinase family protein [Kofleriaceae bacterium]
MSKPRRKPEGQKQAPISAEPRVALYHRVSTLDQDRTLARRELESWAARQGATVVMVEEESASGAWNGRPGLHRVLAAAQRGEVDTVVVWKLDRWGRSALDVLANIQALTDAGARFVAISQGLDVKPSGDAMSRLMLTVLAAVAEFERDLIKERTHLGLARARRAGKTLGRPKADGPKPAAVRKLRKLGKSWSEVAIELGCTVGMARRRASEAAC